MRKRERDREKEKEKDERRDTARIGDEARGAAPEEEEEEEERGSLSDDLQPVRGGQKQREKKEPGIAEEFDRLVGRGMGVGVGSNPAMDRGERKRQRAKDDWL